MILVIETLMSDFQRTAKGALNPNSGLRLILL